MSKIGKNMGNAGRVVPEWSEVQAADMRIRVKVFSLEGLIRTVGLKVNKSFLILLLIL